MIRLSTFDHSLVVLAVKNYAQNKRGERLAEKLSSGYIWIAQTDAEDALLIDASTDITMTTDLDSPSMIQRADERAQLRFDTLDAARSMIDEKQIPLRLPSDRNLDSDIEEDR